MLDLITRLRHGALRRLGMWQLAGRAFRSFQSHTGLPRSAFKKIGVYGPFLLSGRFAFSDYASWGAGHNSGYVACVELSRGCRCVLDVGAHIGLVTLPVSRVVAPGGEVYAFEPAQANLHYLRAHIALNGLSNVTVVESLVGAEPRNEVPFFEQSGDSGLNTTADRGGELGFAPTTRRQVTLDGFCAERGLQPDVIKIDVEGAEVGVLRGAERTLRSKRPTVILSVHPRQMLSLGATVEELEQLLRELGYRATTPDGGPAVSLKFGEYVLRHTLGGPQ